MRSITRAIALTLALSAGAWLLTGCSGREVTVPEESVASEETPAVTELIYETRVSVAPDESPSFEFVVRVFGEPTFDEETGELSVSRLQDDGGVGSTSFDPTPCGYQRNADLVIPISLSVTSTGDKPFVGDLQMNLDDVYGFGVDQTDSLWAYTGRVTMLDDPECLSIDPAGSKYLYWLQSFPDGLDPDFGEATDMRFLSIQNGLNLPEDRKQKLLSSLSLQITPTASVPDGEKVKIDYLTPDTVRILTGNGCLSVHQPLSLAQPNAAFTTLGEQNCDARIFDTGYAQVG